MERSRTPDPHPTIGVFGSPVSHFGVIATVGSFCAAAILVLYMLVKLWPHPTPSGEPPTEAPPARNVAPARDSAPVRDTMARTAVVTLRRELALRGLLQQSAPAGARPAAADTSSPGLLWCDRSIRPRRYTLTPPDYVLDPECVSLFRRAFPMWAEQRLLVITLLAGVLGGLIHALRSLGWYVGNRRLVRSWVPYYFVLPLTGGLLAVAFYLVVRGGFFSPSGSFRDTSPLGFAAMAVLVGMFSTPAALKLQQLAETMFSKPRDGEDPAPPQAPTLTSSGSGTAPTPAPSTGASTDGSERGDLPTNPASIGTAFG